jgi:DNA-directed RNA polymerase specialized sigma24 family protein
VRPFEAASGSVPARGQPQGLALPDPRNTFIDQYRRRRNNPTVGGLDTVDPAGQGAAQGDWLRGDIDLDRLRNVVAEETEKAMMQLSEEAWTVTLLDLGGQTETEVAEILGCAVGTVKSRLATRSSPISKRTNCEH